MTGTYSGQFVMEVRFVWLLTVSIETKEIQCDDVFLFFSWLFWKGLLKPAVVSVCASAADPFHRHHAHAAGGYLSGCAASDWDERLP